MATMFNLLNTLALVLAASLGSVLAAPTAGAGAGQPVPVVPGAATNVQLVVLDQTRLHVAWEHPSTDGGSEITSYVSPATPLSAGAGPTVRSQPTRRNGAGPTNVSCRAHVLAF